MIFLSFNVPSCSLSNPGWHLIQIASSVHVKALMDTVIPPHLISLGIKTDVENRETLVVVSYGFCLVVSRIYSGQFSKHPHMRARLSSLISLLGLRSVPTTSPWRCLLLPRVIPTWEIFIWTGLLIVKADLMDSRCLVSWSSWTDHC